MKTIIAIIALSASSAWASCDITMSNQAFYQCIERQNVLDDQTRRLQRIEDQNKEIIMHQHRLPNSCFIDFSGVKRCN